MISVLVNSEMVLAQQDAHFSLYRSHMTMFNPAITGEGGESFLNLSHKSQWHGIENAPETQVVSFGSPIVGERAGIGFNIINDATFAKDQTSFFANFSYRLPMSEKTNLYLGLQVGGNALRIDGNKLNTFGINGKNVDPLLIDHSQFNPNFGVGIHLKTPKSFISLSAPKILNTSNLIEVNGFYTAVTDQVHTYISAGTDFYLSQDWILTPYFLSRYVNYAPIFTSLNIALRKRDHIEFGAEYNLDTSMAGSLIIQLGEFRIGYAYSRSVHNEINQYTTGSHELLLRIRLDSVIQNLGITDNSRLRKDKYIGTKNNEINNISRKF